MGLQVITTGDQSHTLFNPALNETYHSRHGAIAESAHVFIKNGLASFLETTVSVNIFEVGFGTGLNAMLSIKAVKNANARIRYHTIEKHPLDASILQELNYASLLGDVELKTDLLKIHAVKWDDDVEISPNFTLRKINGDIVDIRLPSNFYELIYFDAFAPAKQPEMWTEEILSKMYDILKPGGILVTYCSQGQFKRNLKSVGFSVENMPGPLGKREMTRAVKLSC